MCLHFTEDKISDLADVSMRRSCLEGHFLLKEKLWGKSPLPLLHMSHANMNKNTETAQLPEWMCKFTYRQLIME